MNMALRVLTALGVRFDPRRGRQISISPPATRSASPGGIGQGNLFLLEAATAVLVGLYVLIRGSRISFALALLVALSAFGAVMLYRYVDIPAFGPFPAMYDPVWFFEKTLSAVAEGAGVLLAGAGLMRGSSRRA